MAEPEGTTTVVHRGRLDPALAAALHQADVVGRISLNLAAAESTDEAFPSVVRLCTELLPAAGAAIWAYSVGDDRLACVAAWGLDEGSLGRQIAPTADAEAAEAQALHDDQPVQAPLSASALHDLVSVAENEAVVIVVPLTSGGQRHGVLVCYGSLPATPSEMTLLRVIARRVARAWAFLLRHDAERRRAQEALVLAEIARVAGSTLGLDEVLARIARRAGELAGADRCSIWLWDEPRGLLLPSALYGIDPAFTADWKKRPLDLEDEHLSQEAIRTGDPVVVDDAAADPRTDKAAVDLFGDRSILVVPLAVRGRIVGTMFLNYVRELHPWTPQDVAVASAIGSQAAIAIEDARLFQQSRQQAAQLRHAFHLIGQALVGGRDLDATLHLIGEMAAEIVQADECVIHVDGLSRTAGSNAAFDVTVERDSTLPIAATDVTASDPEPVGELTLPLTLDGRQIGFVRLCRAHGVFRPTEREVLFSFAAQAAAAIGNAEVDRLKTDFISMVSHELRTPLALITGYVSTLLNQSLDLPPATQQGFLQGIRTAADRLKRLINNVLNVTRVESEFFEMNATLLDLGTVVGAAVDATSLAAQGSPIAVQQSDGPVLVHADQEHLVQVLDNLIANALKYGPQEGPVIVEVGRTASHGWVRVQDRGPGVPLDQLDRIFDKFYRVSGTVGKRPAGTGLGLYIARRLVELYSGRIWAENAADGGVCFFFELPLARDEGADSNPEAGRLAPPAAAPPASA